MQTEKPNATPQKMIASMKPPTDHDITPRRFQPPGVPANEKVRLAALHSLNILDTIPEEPRFDRITLEVQKTFDLPFVFISMVDKDRQWFKSTQWACSIPAGGTPKETGRDISFCGHTILGGNKIMVVEDTLLDDRFADNPLVTGPPLKIRFYAGCPLNVGREDCGGEAINVGTLCMIDQKPRKLTQSQLKRFRAFANQVKREILKGNGLPQGFFE